MRLQDTTQPPSTELGQRLNEAVLECGRLEKKSAGVNTQTITLEFAKDFDVAGTHPVAHFNRSTENTLFPGAMHQGIELAS
jgi:hypothetical protein